MDPHAGAARMNRGRHIMMQARSHHNPSRAATKSHAGVRVQRQRARPSRPAAEMHCSGTHKAQQPVPYRRSADSFRASPTAKTYIFWAQIKDGRSARLCTGWSAIRWLSGSAECGQARQAWSDEAAQRLKNHEKSIRLSECGRAWANRLGIRHGDRAE